MKDWFQRNEDLLTFTLFGMGLIISIGICFAMVILAEGYARTMQCEQAQQGG